MLTERRLAGRRAAALLLACALLGAQSVPVARALEYQGEARGVPVPPYPSAGAIAAAVRFIDSRGGATAQRKSES